MPDEGTLATTAQVLLAIGQDASTAQILEANTNIWIKWAEADLSIEAKNDLKANFSDIGSIYKEWIAGVASARAAFYAIQQDQDNWQLAVTQSKLNVIDNIWQEARRKFSDTDVLSRMGLSIED